MELQVVSDKAVGRVLVGGRQAELGRAPDQVAGSVPLLPVDADENLDHRRPSHTRDPGGSVEGATTNWAVFAEVDVDVGVVGVRPADGALLHPEVADAVLAIGELGGVGLVGAVAVRGLRSEGVGLVEGEVLTQGWACVPSRGPAAGSRVLGCREDLHIVHPGRTVRGVCAGMRHDEDGHLGEFAAVETRRGLVPEAIRRGLHLGQHRLAPVNGPEHTHRRGHAPALHPCCEDVLGVRLACELLGNPGGLEGFGDVEAEAPGGVVALVVGDLHDIEEGVGDGPVL